MCFPRYNVVCMSFLKCLYEILVFVSMVSVFIIFPAVSLVHLSFTVEAHDHIIERRHPIQQSYPSGTTQITFAFVSDTAISFWYITKDTPQNCPKFLTSSKYSVGVHTYIDVTFSGITSGRLYENCRVSFADLNNANDTEVFVLPRFGVDVPLSTIYHREGAETVNTVIGSVSHFFKENVLFLLVIVVFGSILMFWFRSLFG